MSTHTLTQVLQIARFLNNRVSLEDVHVDGID